MSVKTKTILKSREDGCLLEPEKSYRISETRFRISPGPKNKL